jgi:hypothetical protein
MRCGDLFRLNGEDGNYETKGYSKHFSKGEPFVLTAMINGTYDRTGYNSLPGYFVNRSPEMLVSEVIAYDRRLSDEEIAEIEGYLKAKWIDNKGEIPQENEIVLGAGSVITIAAKNGEVGKLTVDGDLNLDNVSFRLVDTKTLVSRDAKTVVEATGTITGPVVELGRENAGNWRLERVGDGLRLYKPGFFLLMR